MSPKSERKEQLTSHVRRELLHEKVKRMKQEATIVTPVQEWARMIGFLSGIGHVSPTGISIQTSDEELLGLFQVVGENLFQRNVVFRSVRGKQEGEYKIANLYDTQGARSLGDLGKHNWAKTVAEKHSWILLDQKHIWAFLGGFFDARGQAYQATPYGTSNIRLSIGYLQNTDFLIGLLNRVGVEKPRLSTKRGKTRELLLSDREDVRLFVQNVHSRWQKKEEALAVLRNEETRESETANFNPSREFAWIIGVLAGGGSVELDGKRIAVDSVDTDFLEQFKTLGESALRLNARYRTKKTEKGIEPKGVVFYSTNLVRVLGDLRRPFWPRTILEKHGWILQNEEYIWGFLEGIFDRIGHIENLSRKGRVRKELTFRTVYLGIANFLAELLTRVGVKRVSYDYDKRHREGIIGIKLHGKNTFLVAQNIHSKIPEKEDRLQVYRRLAFKSQSSNARMREEKIGIKGSFKGKKEAGEGFRIRIARDEKKGKVSVADGISDALLKYREEKGVQIRYVPKIHRDLNKETESARRLEEVIFRAQDREKSLQKSVLVSPSGEFFTTSLEVRKEKGDFEIITPSRELAWVLGVFAGGGYLGISEKNKGVISIKSKDLKFLEAFSSTIEQALGLKVRLKTYHRVDKDGQKKTTNKIQARSINTVRALGDFRRHAWLQTLLEKHKWLLEDPRYFWDF